MFTVVGLAVSNIIIGQRSEWSGHNEIVCNSIKMQFSTKHTTELK